MMFAGCCTTNSDRKGTIDEPPSAGPHDPLPDAMVGKWVATGTIADAKRVDDVEAAWILNSNYLRLHEVSRKKDASGRPVYEAVVLMEKDPSRHDYGCLWLDTTTGGGLGPNKAARGQAHGDSIAFLFKSSETESFHTTFVYDRAGGTWSWIMDGESAGKLEPFARLKLTKNPSPKVIVNTP